MGNRISLGATSPYNIDLDIMAVTDKESGSKVADLGQQPIFNIAGTDFYVEIYSQSLIEVGDPRNFLPIRDMVDTGDHYEFPYHSGYKGWPTQLDDPRESIDVKVPYLIVLDPEGIARKHNISVEELKGKKDIEFLNPNYEGFLSRISGELPTIDIAGDEYFVDLENKLLRLKTGEGQKLAFKDMQRGCPLSDAFSYRFAYDPENRKLVALESASHKDAVMVNLPTEVKLDPVGLARQLGYSDEHYIRDYPIEKKLLAEIRMIKKAPLSESISDSVKKKQQRKKGHGL